jgi:hypothetical protein
LVCLPFEFIEVAFQKCFAARVVSKKERKKPLTKRTERNRDRLKSRVAQEGGLVRKATRRQPALRTQDRNHPMGLRAKVVIAHQPETAAT